MTLTNSQVLETLVLLLGGVLLFKKFAEMSRFHELRVFILTTLLSLIVIYLFLGSPLGDPIRTDCEPEFFSQSEM